MLQTQGIFFDVPVSLLKEVIELLERNETVAGPKYSVSTILIFSNKHAYFFL